LEVQEQDLIKNFKEIAVYIQLKRVEKFFEILSGSSKIIDLPMHLKKIHIRCKRITH